MRTRTHERGRILRRTSGRGELLARFRLSCSRVGASPVDVGNRELAAQLPARDRRRRLSRRDRRRPRRCRIPMADIYGDLVCDRAQGIRASGPHGELSSARARRVVPAPDSSCRRPFLRSVDSAFRPGGPRSRRAGGDDRGGRERRPNPLPGNRRQGAGLGALHWHGGVGRPRGSDRPDRLRLCVEYRADRAATRKPPAHLGRVWGGGGESRRPSTRR